MTLALVWLVHEREDERIRGQLAGDVGIAVASLQRELALSLELLRSFRRLFEISPEITREQFRTVATDALRTHPEIQAIEWLPRVSAADRPRFEQAARDDGFRGFEFTERRRDRQPPNELGNQTEVEKILRFDRLQELAHATMVLALNIGAKSQSLHPYPTLDDLFESDERPPADE